MSSFLSTYINSICYPFNPGPVKSVLEDVLSTLKEAMRGAKARFAERRSRPNLMAMFNMTLSPASRTGRQIVQREMRRIINSFLRSDMYHHDTFHFQEIVPIIGHCVIEHYLIYVIHIL